MKLHLELVHTSNFQADDRYADRDAATVTAGIDDVGAVALYYVSPAPARTDRVGHVTLFEGQRCAVYVQRLTRDVRRRTQGGRCTGADLSLRFENGYAFGAAVNVQDSLDAIEDAFDLWGEGPLDLRLPGGRYEAMQSLSSVVPSVALVAAGALLAVFASLFR